MTTILQSGRSRGIATIDVVVSFLLGEVMASAFFERVVDPHSTLGEWLFWPETHSVLLRHVASQTAHRISFLMVTLCTGAFCLLLALVVKAARRPIDSPAYLLIAIIAPLICWLVIRRADVFTLFVLLLSAALAWNAVVLRRREWKHPHIWYFEIIVWLGCWIYLFGSMLDPALLFVPVLATVVLLMSSGAIGTGLHSGSSTAAEA